MYSVGPYTFTQTDAERTVFRARDVWEFIEAGSLHTALRYLQQRSRHSAVPSAPVDLVLLDLTDPETLAGPLYTKAFFTHCQRILAPGGAMSLHLGPPFHEPERVRGLAAELASVFAQVHCYGLHVPLYGSYWAFAVVSDMLWPAALSAAEVRQRLDERGVAGLQYYNAEIHGALFALPNFYRALVPH